MSKLVGDSLPNDLYLRLKGIDLQTCAEKAILICTIDAKGFAHPAMLSYFEVVAKDPRNVRLATYRNSSTSNNMRRHGKLTILILDTRTAYYIKGTVAELAPEMSSSPQNSKFNLQVEQVLADETNDTFEAEAHVMTGVTYKRSTELEPAQAEELLAELLD